MCKEEGCCSCWVRPNLPILIIGLLVGLLEFILALCVQFYATGFTFGLISLLATGFFGFMWFKKRSEVSDKVDNEEGKLLPADERSKMERTNCIVKSLWLVYIVYNLFFLGFMSFIRLMAISAHGSWRSDNSDYIPLQCGDWSVEDGCTYVSLRNYQCVRAGDIPEKLTVLFSEEDNTCSMIAKATSECADSLGYKI